MVREGRALLERARATPDLAFVTYAFESRALADGGDFEAALEAARPGIELMRRRGMHRSHQAWLEAVVASSLIKLGRWSEATAVLDAALARGPMGITRRFVQLLRAELALARGDLAAAPDSLVDGRSAARGDRPFTGKLFEIASGLAVARRDFDSARSSAGDGLAALEALDDAQANVWLCWRGLQGEADRAQQARASRRVAEAGAAVEVANGLVERARAAGRRQAARSAAEIPVLLLSCDADHARVTSRPAADAWVAAAAGWASLREPYPRAYCLVRGVDAGLAERRSKAGIAAMLSSAREIAAELGAEPLGRCAESLARRGRVAITSRGVESHEHEPAARAPLGLTPREIEVLWLVGQGYTNGQIADTLFISRKTAAAHVSNILHKLGADRRAEAAAIAARLDLLDEPSLT